MLTKEGAYKVKSFEWINKPKVWVVELGVLTGID